MYQTFAAQPFAADSTTLVEREQILTLARQLDGIEIRESLIPNGAVEASALIKSLQKRVVRKRETGVRSSLASFWASADGGKTA
jgi:hypothetical protein